MKNLVEALKKETKTLKIQFIQMNKDWAKKEFKRYENTTYINILEKYGILTKGFKGVEFYAKTRKSEAEANKRIKILSLGLEGFLLETEKQANLHYNQSIEKLAFRIEKKGLDTNKLKTLTSHIGVNIETTLTDGNKKVTAFTIIAEGEIQRPHYRYLIKW